MIYYYLKFFIENYNQEIILDYQVNYMTKNIYLLNY